MEKHFTYFKQDIKRIERPQKFDFPFYYRPHRLAQIAAKELQDYLAEQQDWYHDFGLQADSPPQACGKMFGVLVVENKQGELGYLRAFSGKMANTLNLDPFVPPVFDILVEGDFYKDGEQEVNALNRQLEEKEQAPAYREAQLAVEAAKEQRDEELAQHKAIQKRAKQKRDEKRKEMSDLNPSQAETLEKELRAESTHLSYQFKKLKASLGEELAQKEAELKAWQDEIDGLKQARRERSAGLQRQIFEQFQFLNAQQERRSLYDIFQHTVNETPPAGAGDCAAPKLLHYAYRHGLKPVCMAEFWWGRPPRNEVRKHLQFYTSCRGKCEPILGHMLQGLAVDQNPMLKASAEAVHLDIIYEDEYMLAVNKPAEFLSVPGKHISDSVFQRMREQYPEATGPLVVHRLDMSTSGLLLIAKDRKSHKRLQEQFKKRIVEKTYLALLEGEVEGQEGIINMPLRVDLNDRPRQLVCYDYGKAAVTKWKVLERRAGETLIQFHPITGRTHQLRVHAAHAEGLACAIKGDDLYGTKADRLYLHAAQIRFRHPRSGEWLSLETSVNW